MPDIDKIVENAYAKATLSFKDELEKEFKVLHEEDYIWAGARIEALEKTIPVLVKNMLKYALLEISQEISK